MRRVFYTPSMEGVGRVGVETVRVAVAACAVVYGSRYCGLLVAIDVFYRCNRSRILTDGWVIAA